MARYSVEMRVDARYLAEVEAESIEEARVKANSAFEGADFGEAYNIDASITSIQDEAGNFVSLR